MNGECHYGFRIFKVLGKISYEDKCSQKLYRDVIYESNWCDVWKDIELNPKKYQSFNEFS